MESLELGRYALGMGAASAMLVGCGGSQPPIGAPGAMPQTSAIATHADRGKSWMLPEAKGEDLLYVAACGGSGVSVFSYPRGKLVGSLHVAGCGLCSKANGDFYVTSGDHIYEYAHGGTRPIATLTDFTGNAFDCSVDPTTRNLAVTNPQAYYSGPGSVMVYKGDHLKLIYWDSGLYFINFCAYDDKGDLFIDGSTYGSSDTGFAELPKHSRRLRTVTLNQTFANAGAIRWDGAHLVVGQGSSSQQSSTLYQFAISGSEGTEVGAITLDGALDLSWFWIQGSRVIGSDDSKNADAGIWKYPIGGNPIKTLSEAPEGGVTVSVAPSGSGE
ncbi:MAG: hypothetical protein WA431_18265 [Candidatus Cybelea sp.]